MHTTTTTHSPADCPSPEDGLLQAALLVLSIAYLLWLQGIVKDSLLSSKELYPYTAWFAITISVAGGFVALFVTRKAAHWRDSVLWAGFFLTVADLLGTLPKDLGIFPGVSAFSLAFGLASFFAARRRARDGNEKLYAAVAISGALSLCGHSLQSKKLWAVFVVLVVASISGLTVWLADASSGARSGIQPKRGAALARYCRIAIVGGFGILFWLTVGRSLQFRISDASMLGLGLEWYWKTGLSVTHFLYFVTCLVLALVGMVLVRNLPRFPPLLSRVKERFFPAPLIYLVYFGGALAILAVSCGQGRPEGTPAAERWFSEPLGLIVATEFGLLTVLALGLALWIAVGIGVMRLFRVSAGLEKEAQEVDIALWAGSISSLYAALLVIPLGHPFMTSDSVGGTLALAVAVASVSIQSPTGPRARTLFRRASMAFSKERNLLLLIGSLAGVALVASMIGAAYYQRRLMLKIVPYMGSGSPLDFPPGFVALSDISTTMQDALLASEDPGFYEHHGFEWKALHSALRLNLREGRVIKGNSTITQQLAKNLFLTKERTLSRKIQEAFFTVELERLLSKQRILELYFNLIDFGMEQRGISDAAQYYFRKTPKELSLPESALLAGLISRPIRSLSFYQLAIGQHRSLNLMRHRWGDRYPRSDTDRAKAIPLQLLCLPADGSEAQQNAQNQQDPASLQDSEGAAHHWHKVAILIVIGVTSGCFLTIAMGVRALRIANRARGGLPARIASLQVLLCVAFWSVFATLSLHWYQINRELAVTTVLNAYRRSPNYDLRPEGSHINCVVLHASTQYTLEATIRVFQYPTSLVSAHFIVGKEGRVFQTVPLERRAWHAGTSQLDGETDVNNFSVGIELVNLNDGIDPYPDLQYEAVARLIFQLRQRYQIPNSRIVSHAQIALPPGRKADPIGLDFERLRKLLNAFSVAAPR